MLLLSEKPIGKAWDSSNKVYTPTHPANYTVNNFPHDFLFDLLLCVCLYVSLSLSTKVYFKASLSNFEKKILLRFETISSLRPPSNTRIFIV
jgi:hypothetical protein